MSVTTGPPQFALQPGPSPAPVPSRLRKLGCAGVLFVLGGVGNSLLDRAIPDTEWWSRITKGWWPWLMSALEWLPSHMFHIATFLGVILLMGVWTALEQRDEKWESVLAEVNRKLKDAYDKRDEYVRPFREETERLTDRKAERVAACSRAINSAIQEAEGVRRNERGVADQVAVDWLRRAGGNICLFLTRDAQTRWMAIIQDPWTNYGNYAGGAMLGIAARMARFRDELSPDDVTLDRSM